MHLSIVIVNWNTRELLGRCLDSIAAHPPNAAYEIWVVDNASSDDSVPFIQNHHPGVRLIANDRNLGFATANNQAIRKSSGRYVLLLNSDTEVEAGALTLLVEHLDEHPDTGAVGSTLLNPDRSLQVSCYPFPTLSREFWRLFHLDSLHPYGVYDMSAWDTTSPREVEVIQGACLALRRSALDQTGLLDEDFFMYTEEVDLCYRLHRAGWRLIWVPAARVLHYGGQSTRQAAARMFLRLYESKLLFFRKNRGAIAAAAYKGILSAASLARLVALPIAAAFFPERRGAFREISGNYKRLLAALPGL